MYRVMISQADHINYQEILDYCDGADSIIFVQKYCEIPIADFKVLPFNYVAGGAVRAKF
jgi:hypothetical protein